LNELAAALGDDANYASTTTTALGNRYTKAETDGKIVELSPPATKSHVDSLGINAATLTGALPAISGANLTDIDAATVSTTDPSSPAAGDMWFDTTTGTNSMYVWSGSAWDQMSNRFSATGGSLGTYSAYKLHIFNSSGTFNVDTSGTVDVLVVAGGGGGGGNSTSGAGGAGGLIWGTGLKIPPGSYSVVVGSGGGAGGGEYAGGNGVGGKGGDSTIFGLTAKGGGAGVDDLADFSQSRADGGCGAGGQSRNSESGYYGQTNQQTSWTVFSSSNITGYGTRGGASTQIGDRNSGSGGGAGARGLDGVNNNGMAGGAGKDMSSYVGTAYGESGWFAGGGGGTRENNEGNGGAGGQGGGGNGMRISSNGSLHNASVNTGGGGGAGGYYNSVQQTGGAGGSGIVIVRYAV
jgi:hypothetical protein